VLSACAPGVGLLGATALAATVTDLSQFRSGRQFAAWLGLTLLQNCSGGKERLGRISKMGDKYLRRLLINGMTSIVARNAYRPGVAEARVTALLTRKPLRVATVATANHAARAIWAIMTRGEIYRAPAPPEPSPPDTARSTRHTRNELREGRRKPDVSGAWDSGPRVDSGNVSGGYRSSR